MHFFLYLSNPAYEETEAEELDPENPPSPELENYEDTRLSFHINFIRPDYFGLEAFPIIEKITSELDLYCLNPQGEESLPIKYSWEQLYLNWSESNTTFNKDFSVVQNLPILPKSIGHTIWRYLLNKITLQRELTDDVFVPKISVVKTQDNRTITFTVWPNHIPILLPPSDYVYIIKVSKFLFYTKKKLFLVSYKNIMASFSSNFVPFENTEVPDLRVLYPDQAQKIARKFNALKADLHEKDLDRTSQGGFVTGD